MADKHERYVALFDALGFKEAVARNLHEAWGVLEDLRVSMEETLNLFVKLPKGKILIQNSERTAATNFSDSVIIFTKGDEIEDLQSIFISSTAFFAKALNRCVPLRGAISHGEFLFNPEKNLFCGVPLNRAWCLAESVPWSGIIIDECVAKRYSENPLMSGGKSVIVRWNVQRKAISERVQESLWVLNWPLVCKENFNQDIKLSPESYSSAFYSIFGSSYEKWAEDVRAKYDNTVEFIKQMLDSTVG
ncbi:MAG: hypothetical protein JW720_05890 [Sedimentisphaerales bacterium]|nr:hypothetical protein [Sedimentisphaerales bacterium]